MSASASDPLGDDISAHMLSPVVVLSTTPPPHDPPPPYPSRERRTRTPRTRRRRRTFEQAEEAARTQFLSTPTGPDSENEPYGFERHPHLFDPEDHEHDATENTPLLTPSTTSQRSGPRPALAVGMGRRQRTLSVTSTLHSFTSVAPSLAQTVFSAFNPERDSDLDPECRVPDGAGENESEGEGPLDSPSPRTGRTLEDQQRASQAELSGQQLERHRGLSWGQRWRRYFRPLGRRAYYAALFHLLLLNFPYALFAWIYLFVFTVAGTTTLMALPLGAVLCFLDLIGARIISRGELALQTSFHGPLAYTPPSPPHPIFIRLRQPSFADIEAGIGTMPERSFYRNAYAMFTDPTSYQAIFYFLVIKPGITVLLFLLLVVLTPLSFVLIVPAPAALRLARRLGIWQANIAVEGLGLTIW
ncbi:hypothetical protein AcV5_006677 [Taiwanofungus camphoratus]|nr:hypothetical protein AcV5_006677 [Antrodia cinnamomea]KAI0935425.1 hypothetical protein AcV7_003859 [Antrodia cinnamomea]